MPGTKHFSRMHYHVSRGLREIVAPRQTMSKLEWETVKQAFDGTCAFCGEGATQPNRGIVPDHLIPVTQFGELVIGNTVPACQTCNDSRGHRDWRAFLKERFPEAAARRAQRIDQYLEKHPYTAQSPEVALSETEFSEYGTMLERWDELLRVAKRLQAAVEARRNG